MGDTKERVSSRYKRTGEHMVVCTEPAQLSARQCPRTERGKWTCSPLPNQQALLYQHPVATERLVFF